MRTKVKFIPILAMLALLATLFIMLPVSADDELVEIRDAPVDPDDAEKIDWIGVGGQVTLHVADPDLNEGMEVTGEVLDYSLGADGLGACDAVGALRDVRVVNLPIDDATGDGVVNFLDVTLGTGANSETSVLSVDGPNGKVILKCETATGGTTTQIVAYEGATRNSTFVDTDDDNVDDTELVHVSSGADPTGFDITLTETGPTSGEYFSLLDLVATASNPTATPPQLQVNDAANDTVELVYDDEDLGNIEDLVTVESRAPSFGNFLPSDESADNDREPQFSVDITDGDSGIPLDNDDLIDAGWVFRLTNLAGAVLPLTNNPFTHDANLGEVIEIPAGWSIEDELPGVTIGFPTVDTYLIEWWVQATDLAGNVGVSDEDDDTDCDPALFTINTGGNVDGGCDPFVVRVDKDEPVIQRATTGNVYDESDEELDTGQDGSRTSIQVIFDAPMDGDSIILANFSSDDVVITGVDWFDEDNVDGPDLNTVVDGDGEAGCIRCSAFLITEEMASDAEPEIDVSKDVLDAAGNDMDADDGITAYDSIAAELTITVTGTASSRAVSDENMTVAVQSDENLLGSPTVFVFRIEDDFTLAGLNLADPNDLALVDTENRIWDIEMDLDGNGAGLYNVFVAGTETGPDHIVTEVGIQGDIAGDIIDIEDDDVILFEIDTGVPVPVFSPADEGETTNPNTFISIDFADEGSEYGLDLLGVFTEVPADVDENFDEHEKVTLTSATLDGVDILDQVNTEDGVLFLYKASGLSLGEHEISITVVDESGNEIDADDAFEATFDVEEPELFELEVNPGWNLLSLPGSPRDSDITTVFANNPDVVAVQTYNAVTNSWVVAVRVDGDWSGELTDITANRAYWINTASFKDVEVHIPGIAGGQQILPPTIDVVVGWNLIPILDITGEQVSGDPIIADRYLSELKWVKAYSFDTINNNFDVILPDQDATDPNGDLTDPDNYPPEGQLLVGNGYWVFFEKAGTLVP